MMKKISSLIFLLTFIFGVQAQQPSKDELQRKTQSLLKEIDAVKKDLEDTKASKRKSLGDLKQVERKISMRNQVIYNMKTEVWMVEREILKTYRDIDTLKEELTLLKEQYGQSIVYAYKNRSNYDFLNFIFSSSSFSDALRRLSYLKTYRSFREQKATDILNANKDLSDKIASLGTKRKEKSGAVEMQAVQMGELEKEKKEKDVVVSQIQSRETELTKMFANKDRERKQIQAAIAAVIKREKEEALRAERLLAAARKKEADEAAALKRAADAKLVASGKTPEPAAPAVKKVSVPEPVKNRTVSVLENAPEAALVSQKFEENRGRLPWPVEKGVITLRFGKNAVPAKMRDINVISEGLSFETNVGSSVKTIFDGEVSSVFNIGNFKIIMIKHGRYFSTYGNLSSANVTKGQMVKTGQVIGKAGINDYGEGEVTLQLDTESDTINPEPWIIRR